MEKLILPRDACVRQSWSDKGCLPFQGLMFQWPHFLSEKKIRQNWQTCIGFILVSKPDQIQNQFVAAYTGTRMLNCDSYKFCSRNYIINIFIERKLGPNCCHISYPWMTYLNKIFNRNLFLLYKIYKLLPYLKYVFIE